VVVVFDADMACKKEFFLKVLEVMCDQDTALCLTPQVRTATMLPAQAVDLSAL
jgi:cellulose synthase/poly-beta-1,6-N-acetylglucosamine synthase-like glycosyltransferase